LFLDTTWHAMAAWVSLYDEVPVSVALQNLPSFTGRPSSREGHMSMFR